MALYTMIFCSCIPVNITRPSVTVNETRKRVLKNTLGDHVRSGYYYTHSREKKNRTYLSRLSGKKNRRIESRDSLKRLSRIIAKIKTVKYAQIYIIFKLITNIFIFFHRSLSKKMHGSKEMWNRRRFISVG